MPEDVLTTKFEAFLTDTRQHRDDTNKALAEIMKDGKENLIQSIKTNGRVGVLEKTAGAHSIAIEEFQELRWWVKGAFWLWCAIVPLFLLVMPFAVNYYVHKVAAEESDTAIRRAFIEAFPTKSLSTPVNWQQ